MPSVAARAFRRRGWVVRDAKIRMLMDQAAAYYRDKGRQVEVSEGELRMLVNAAEIGIAALQCSFACEADEEESNRNFSVAIDMTLRATRFTPIAGGPSLPGEMSQNAKLQNLTLGIVAVIDARFRAFSTRCRIEDKLAEDASDA